jgi:uncharacterized protein (TIGR03437 family)
MNRVLLTCFAKDLAVVTALLVAILATPPCTAQRYTFTNIADSREGGLQGFGAGIAINDEGRVVFHASATHSGTGIYSGDGGPLTTVVPPMIGLPIFQVNSINSNGTVAFLTLLPTGPVIQSGDGGPLRTVAQSDGNPFTSFQHLASINDLGAIAYLASQGSISGVFTTGPDGVHNKVADTNIPLALLDGVTINNSGQVAFLTASPQAIRIADGETVTTVVDETDELLFVGPTPRPALNDNGTVAFIAFFGAALPAAEQRVVIGNGGELTTIAARGNTFRNIVAVSISNSGTVAFGAELPNRTEGIFTGPDPDLDRVIGFGDPLFGSTVTFAGVPFGATEFINSRDQIAFSYQLSDAVNGNPVRGIAVATPAGLPPSLPANSVVNAASFISFGEPGYEPAPGSIVSVFGAEFATKLTLAETSPLPRELDGIRVNFDGIPAPLFFTAAGQVNAQLPFEVTGESIEVKVTNANGESAARVMQIAPASPAIFTFNQSGAGQGIVVFADTPTLAAPLGTTPDSQPARAGDVLTIFANGLGAVTPAIESGRNSCEPDGVCEPDFSNLVLRTAVVRPSIEIGGVVIPDADIIFAGLAPQFVGLYQINITLPAGIRSGDAVPIIIRQGTTSSRSDVSIAVK